MTMGFGFCFVLFSVVYTGIVFLSVLRQDSQMVFVLVCFIYRGCKVTLSDASVLCDFYIQWGGHPSSHQYQANSW